VRFAFIATEKSLFPGSVDVPDAKGIASRLLCLAAATTGGRPV
jgi:hypothetical protein